MQQNLEFTGSPVRRTGPGKGLAILATRRMGITHLWLWLPILLLIYKGFIFPLPPLDFWWHLKMGEVIASTGSIPTTDLFSYTAAGHPFVVQNWLGELIYYGTYLLGGLPLLIILGTVITLAGFLLVYQLCLLATDRLRLVALIGFLAVLGNFGFLRPQTYSFLLFAVFYFVLEQYRSERADRIWAMPFLMTLWVNLHGAFVLGLGLIGIYFICESVRRLAKPDRTDALSGSQIRKLGLVLLLCLIATLLNPQGPAIYSYVKSVAFDPGSQQLVAEWQPPQITNWIGFIYFYCPFLLGVFTFAAARTKPDFTELSLFVVFAILGFTAIRNASWFSTITYPLLARYLSELDLARVRPLQRLERLLRSAMPPLNAGVSEPTAAQARVNLFVGLLAIVVLITQSPWIRPGLTGKKLVAEQTPVGAADFISDHGLSGRIFHPQVFGDYLIWRLWPQQKTFIDGRVHLFDLDFLEEYKAAVGQLPSEMFLNRWNIRYLLLAKQPAVPNAEIIKSARDSGAWTQLYEDQISVLFERPLP